MNLIFAASGLEPSHRPRVLAAFRTILARCPQVGAEGVRSWVTGDALLACANSDAAVAGDRRYVHEEPGSVTVMDGVVLDPTGRLPAYDAGVLARSWKTLPDGAEGRFTIVRLDRQTGALEVLVDPLGIKPLYLARLGAAALVSTSAGLLELFCGLTEPDPLGVSMFLSTDWVWGDRTIRAGVSVVPGGTLTRLLAGHIARRTHFSPRDLAALHQEAFDADRASRLASEMTTMVRAVSGDGSLSCPISAGKDTRVLAAICVGGGIPAKFWTQGDIGTTDVRIAREFAARYGVRHRFSDRPNSPHDSSNTTRNVIEDWERLVSRIVLRTDGMASLSLIGNVVGIPSHVDRLAATLSGLGGEIARQSPAHPHIYHARHSSAAVRGALVKHYVQHGAGLIRRESVFLARRALEARIDEAASDGIRSADLASLFYTYERARRWGGNNPREFEPSETKVLPFCTRPWMMAAYGTPAADRYVEVIHRGVIGATEPSMMSEPGFDRPWRAPPSPIPMSDRVRWMLAGVIPDALRPAATRVAHAIRRPTVRPAERGIWREIDWLEAKREWLREVALSQSQSPYWQHVDRKRFEYLMDPRTSPKIRGRWMLPLFAASTLFVYDALQQAERRAMRDVAIDP